MLPARWVNFATGASSQINQTILAEQFYTPLVYSYNLNLQYEFLPRWVAEVGYVGSHGYHELIGVDGNEPFPVVCPNPACPTNYPAGFGALAGTPVPAGTFFVPTSVRANPTIANTWTWFSVATSSYHSLQVDLNHRFGSGFSLRGVYTFSKALDDGDSLNATTSGGGPALVANPFDIAADKGLATYDVQQILGINGTYRLPFGRGRKFANGFSGFANALVSGWGVNSIATAQGGFPFTPQLSYNPSNNGDTRNPVRPFANPAFSGPVILGTPAKWFDAKAFLAPPNNAANAGFYGNLGRNTLRGPGLATWDFSAMKDTRLGERLNLQFRTEIFNLLDRANFNMPNEVAFTPSGISPTAGVITSTTTTSRQVQFGLKMLW